MKILIGFLQAILAAAFVQVVAPDLAFGMRMWAAILLLLVFHFDCKS